MAEDEARDQLRRLVASDTFPPLDGYELTDLLEAARRPDVWGILDVGVPLPPGYRRPGGELGTGRGFGRRSTGSTRSGLRGLPTTWATRWSLGVEMGSSTVASTLAQSGSEDPAFVEEPPIPDGTCYWQRIPGAIVWQPTYTSTRRRPWAGAGRRARRTDRVAFGSQGDNYNAEQLHRHCMEMATYYDARSGARSVKTRSPNLKPLDIQRLPRA